ncbi:MAG: monofunctional biosynthetic peptidoglycan transglycosylase [Wenzhouxiangella sp.]|nr:MAG: monofunctional biosynthetic peptidoglycan transglycosylase [Wenzhouxiangella sp.]
MKKRKTGFIRRLFRWFSLALVGCCLLSLLLVVPLRWLPPPITSFIVQAWVEDGQRPDQRWVEFGQISPQMALAVVAAEDQRFPQHRGFDTLEIRRALEAHRDGRPLRGASTISQQTAKNLYLWPGRQLPRKVLEAWFTLLIETTWGKQRILEVYLNIAQFGEGVFGVEAASQHFFGKPAMELSAAEAALLAAVLPAPTRFSVSDPSAHTLERQRWILRQMTQLGGPAYLRDL